MEETQTTTTGVENSTAPISETAPVLEQGPAPEQDYKGIDECFMSNGKPDCYKMQTEIEKYRKENADLASRNDGLRRQFSNKDPYKEILLNYREDTDLKEFYPGLSKEENCAELDNYIKSLDENAKNGFKKVCEKAGVTQKQANMFAMMFLDTATRNHFSKDSLVNKEEFQPQLSDIANAVKLTKDVFGEKWTSEDDLSVDAIVRDKELINFFSKAFRGIVAGLKTKYKAEQGQSSAISNSQSSLAASNGEGTYGYDYASEKKAKETQYLNDIQRGKVKDANISIEQAKERLGGIFLKEMENRQAEKV